MTGLDRTQRYLVVCGELNPDTTYPNSDVGQCQAEEAETTVILVTEEITTASADGSITQRLQDANKDDSKEMTIPYSLIGACISSTAIPR